MKRKTLLAAAGFVLGGIVVASGVIAAPATALRDRKLFDRAPCKREFALAGQSARENLARPEREPRAMLLLAVDRRVNGCRVLSPASAWQSVVPEPEFGNAPAQRRPAHGG